MKRYSVFRPTAESTIDPTTITSTARHDTRLHSLSNIFPPLAHTLHLHTPAHCGIMLPRLHVLPVNRGGAAFGSCIFQPRHTCARRQIDAAMVSAGLQDSARAGRRSCVRLAEAEAPRGA